MDGLSKNWFSEFSPLWPGQALSLEVDKILFDGKSEFQHIVVFQSKTYGKVLILDGAIQLTERDEFSYQEMICHLPLLSHPSPKNICVIGGGDGAVLRQIVKHKSVEKIHLCEIDEMVIAKSKEFFPQFKKGFEDPRVTIVVQDGLKYLESLPEPLFDVIIVDSSDPIGPAEALFSQSFYGLVSGGKGGLRAGGILCAQSECGWLHLNDIILPLVRACRTGVYINEKEPQNNSDQSKARPFSQALYASASVPTYPCGLIGFLVCAHPEQPGEAVNLRVPKRKPSEAFVSEEEVETLRYYTPEIHGASFILPKFMSKVLDQLEPYS